MNLKHYKFYTYEQRGDTWQYWDKPEEGQKDFYMGDVKEDQKGDYFIIPYSTWGDYVGSTVERANYEYFIEQYKDNPFVHSVNGGYDSHFILCNNEILQDEEIKELIEGLDNYPLFNDETLSELEMKLESESWDSWIKHDLKSDLEEAGIEYPEDEKELENLFWHCVRYNSIEFIHEDAVIPFIRIEEVIKHWKDGFCPSCNKELDYEGQECENCPSLFHNK